MSNSLLPEHIKQGLSQETAAVYIAELNALAASHGWQLIQQCLTSMREEIIDQLKVADSQSFNDLRIRLTAFDLIANLPNDVAKEINLSVTEGSKDQFGYVENEAHA